MRLKDLSKTTVFHDMGYMFKTLPSDIITLLESKLEDFFNSQSLLNDAGDVIETDPSNYSFNDSLEESVKR